MSAANPGTPGLLRVLNDQAAIALLLERGSMSRNDLAIATGLSKPTVAEVLRRLESAGLLRSAGERSGTRGPNAGLWEVPADRFPSVAVDIDDAQVRSVVVDVAGRSHPVAELRMSAEDAGADAARMVSAAVTRACAAAAVDEDLITGVAVGLQAAVDHTADRLTFLEDMPGWPRERVAERLTSALGVAVLLENDANLAAIAERRSGAGAAAGSFALLWLTEGVGLALDLDGRVISGAAGAAGEIGYLDAPDGTAVGELVSADAVRAAAADHGVDGPAGLAPDHPLLLELGRRIGIALLPVLAVADPALVVLHGPTGIAGGAALAAATARWLRHSSRWSTPVVAPAVVDAPVLAGARALLLDHTRRTLLDLVDRLPDAHRAP